jgi:hypothetical protein
VARFVLVPVLDYKPRRLIRNLRLYSQWGLLAREQRDRKTEGEKLAAALDIFTELNMPRERDAARAELGKTTGLD